MSITTTNIQNQLLQATGLDADGNARVAKQHLGQEDFLRLLTVQLQNQDPLSPMTDMDFIASMSSFSSVEAMSSLSLNFEKFMKEQTQANLSLLETLGNLEGSIGKTELIQAQLAAQAFLGKEVTIQDPIKGEFTGLVDRIELFDRKQMDGTTDRVVGLVINGEIFASDLVVAVSEQEGTLSSVGNVFSSVVQGVSQIF